MIERLLSALIRVTPLHWHLADRMTRMQLIQYAVDRLAARTYLEIGVDQGEAFCAVRAPIKIGVDPVAAAPAVQAEVKRPGSSYFSIGSDQFFERHAAQVLAGGADVVFIDGLHTYEQTHRDIHNALTHLAPGGVILVHDCLPVSPAEATVASSHAEARRVNDPAWDGMWTGDTWKAIVATRSGHSPGEACVLHCDHGVGVVFKSASPAPLALSRAEIDALDYEDLRRDPERLLGLCRPARLRRILGQLRGQRPAS